MARIRSVDFLPEIFQTPTNTKFLNSTLDQLIQEPKLKQTQGYIGRKSAPGKLPTDGYILEQSDVRTNYQLEPGVIFKDDNGETVDALTYIGMIDGLNTIGANVDDHNRLFTSESYSWSPYIEFDKIVNYSQYFWLPEGPDSVGVSATSVLFSDDFNIEAGDDSFTIEGHPQINPVLTLIRGGEYNFNVDQDGHPFYIQTHPGIDGTVPWAANISSRDILGVTNNGDDAGTINFQVPDADAQIYYHNLTDIGNVDIATDVTMTSIADVELATVQANFAALQDLENKTIVFLTESLVQADWVNNSLNVVSQADRYQIYRIQIEDVAGTDFVRLIPIQPIALEEKFTILYGTVYSNIVFYKNLLGYFEQVPIETASLDVLYYQDAVDPDRFGVINLIDLNEEAIIDVDNILDRATYTSPNGVVFTNGLKVQFRGQVIPAEYIDTEYYVEGVGTAIQLIKVTDLIVPESYSAGSDSPWDIVAWDEGGYAATISSPTDQDYITINRSSLDLNAWSRSNRWFHYDVLVATAEYNEVVLNLDNNARALRPIIEFDANLRLFNYGTVGKHIVHIIDFNQTDAMSNVSGAILNSPEATIDGYKLGAGSLVIFAADEDLTVKNRVYITEVIDADNDGIFTINLVPIVDGESEADDIVTVIFGDILQGVIYTYDGSDWIESQAKSGVNQAPLFNIFDPDGNSLSDETAYESTTFVGSKIFSYAEGTGTIDSVLGFPLRYLNIDNLGDIVFANNLYTDTFSYEIDTVPVVDASITAGLVRKYFTRTEYTNETGWVTSIENTLQPQIFEIAYTGDPVELDITPATDLQIPAVRITADGVFVTPDKYTVTDNIITFLEVLADDTELLIAVHSDEISEDGFYQVPTNLSSNMFNENTTFLTLGTIRNHYGRLSENVIDIQGNVNGANNLRDLGEISKYGTLIVQQSSPIALAAMFMRNREYNFFSATEFASRQYEKFKNQITNWVEQHDLLGLSAADILDNAIKDINIGKTIDSAFYWSDMLPTGLDFETTEHIITAISTSSFTTLNTYDFTVANTSALLVYHNDTLLIKDTDYTVATDGPRITLLITPVVDDIITINEYETTLGANVPSTPTKLGMFPKFKPSKFTDDTYVTPVEVIRGHDGSITIAHGDLRDDVLLEFEKRVYNNIKVTDDLPIVLADVIPGVFRTTDYTDTEVIEILAPSILSWLGWNRIDYKSQEYNVSEAKTWNYSSTTCKLGGSKITKGNWRGIYRSFYDTDAPHERPWEMVGLTERPDWWDTRYGTAPYTSGNLVLWDDMEAGLIKEPGNERVDERYVRPGLTTVLPVDGEGNLVMPLDSVVSEYASSDFKKSWTIGDGAPAEAAWRKSSAWPFAVQRLYALAKPAQYFALMADRDRYKYDIITEQYLYDERYRLDVRDIELQDDNLVKHSYINWIIDYNKHYGYESVENLETDLSNLDVNLCYHMASFTDKNNLKIFTDKSSPDSTNSSLLLPDESFNLLLYKNQTIAEVIYSSVIVQKVEGGYAVIGNSTTDPYFQIQTPVTTGRYTTIDVGRTESSSTSVSIPLDFSDNTELVPYSQIYSSKQAVANFLTSYGEFLLRAGLKFNVVEETQEITWNEMIQSFLYWADQGWAVNSILNLNPAATVIEFERELTIVDDLNNLELTEQPQNQNREPLDISDYVVDRVDNNFKIRMLDDNIISYLKFNLTSFEHLLVLDNVSIFNDLIYDPVTGIRQHRVKLSGFTTYEWNGQLDAQGFLYNEDNVKTWAPVNRYNKGDIVNFKNAYWSAAEKIQPSETFDFGQWVKTDYDKINKGLLPNLATKSDQMLQYYNNKTANLESDIDLMAYGLTGFRSRDYLRGLDLDDISQVNIYSDLIQQKGTPESLTLFKGVTLNNEEVDYTIFENWALKRAEYGATNSRQYIDLQLDDQSLASSPGLIEIVDDIADESAADLLIPVEDIYKQSVKNTDKNIFTTLSERDSDVALPTAGFVKEEDVDIAVFEIADITANVIDGSLIWVAKDTEVDWNVYRATEIDAIVISVNDNLNGTLTLVTDIPHNQVAGATITVIDVDELVDGTHKILEVSESINIVIPGELAVDQTCILEKTGTVLEFITARVEVPADIADTIFNGVDSATDTVWVSNVDNKAAVYEKTAPYISADIENNPFNGGTEFGRSVSQGFNGSGMLIGDPNLITGTVYFYDKVNDAYEYDQTLTLSNNSDILRYGNAISFIETWGAIAGEGAAGVAGVVAIVNRANDTITETQIITAPVPAADDGFGASVAVSKDEHWLFVGRPAGNVVHTYYKTEYEIQVDTIVSTGIKGPFYIGAASSTSNVDISQNNAAEIIVTVDDVEVGFTYANWRVDLVDFPAVGAEIKIARRNSLLYNGTGGTTLFSTANLYAYDGIDSIVVTINGDLQRPSIDYTITGTDVDFTVAPPVGVDNVVITLTTLYRYAADIDYTSFVAGPYGAELFGSEIDVSTDAQHIAITAPGENSGAGTALIINRIAERFIITDASINFYYTLRTPIDSVFVNGVKLTDDQYSVVPIQKLVLITPNLGTINVGDSLEISTNAFELLQEVEAETPIAGMVFGSAAAMCKSKCSVYFGASNDLDGQGSVTHYINHPRLRGIITSTEVNPTIPASSTIRINNIDVAISGNSANVADEINAALIPNIDASEADGYLTIQLTNKTVRSSLNRLDISSGQNVTIATLGLEPYEISQTITSPVTIGTAQGFGYSLSLDLDLNQLAVGTPMGLGNNISTTADSTDTTDDTFITTDTTIANTGVVYMYDILPAADANTEGKLVLGQEIYNTDDRTGDRLGDTVDLIDGSLATSSFEYDTATVDGIGRVSIFNNDPNTACWIQTSLQNDIVDVDLIDTLYIYDTESLDVLRYLDYIDPLSGKVLGAAAQNIDFITPFDPTIYEGTNTGLLWGEAQIGMMWWDISNVRFQDYTIGDAKHSSKVWGKIFEGATVDILQWVESDALPVDYAGSGTVLDEDTYITIESVDRSNLTKNTYYYWVNKVETISVNSEKTLSASAIASYIEAPASSGISYAAIVAPNLIGLYNCKDVINETDSILHTEYSKVKNEDNVFAEYDLFREGHPNDFLSDSLYKKLQDSMCGIDTEEQVVPAAGLSPVDRYGIEFRPRKSMFIDRYAATASYLRKVNGILAENTISESRAYPLLNSEESLPAAGSTGDLAWDEQVVNNEELSFQDFTIVAVGYRYLVETDSTNDGLWAIYEVTASQTFETLDLIRVQTYDTNRYWETVHWYATGFSPFTKIDYVVDEFTELVTLGDIENNAIAKVVHNSVGSWEIYQLADGEWVRKALENGTIQLDERLWTEGELSVQSTELRQVIKSINEELLIGDLAVDRSYAILSIFNYVLAEQPNVDWLYKTSLIDVTQKVRGLEQYAVYQKDNQDYLSEYIGEAKPYHTKVKDFSLSYDGIDYIDGTVTDFDCPATWSAEFEQYISPILDDGAILVTDPSNAQADDPVWQEQPWSEWFDNYKLSVEDVVITNPGTGYTIAPEVIVTGDNTTPAVMEARIGGGGTISEVIIIDSGSGYLVPPVITFAGSTGVDATASAIMDNTLVRTFLATVKYDRYEYLSKVALFEDNIVTTTRNLVFKYKGSNQDTFDGYLVVGADYVITKVGTTDFTLLGAADNVTGTEFTATGAGTIGTLSEVGKVNEIPVLLRVNELYVDGDDNDVYDPTKFEEVLYFVTEDGTKSYTDPTPAIDSVVTIDDTSVTADVDTITVDAAGGYLDEIEMKFFREGVASWYQLDDEFGVPTGVWVNENDNSESRNFVRYINKVYKMIEFSNTSTFTLSKYEEVDIEPLSGIDRTSGFYVSDVNNPGLDLSLLFNGIAYPGVEVDGDTFTVTEDELDTIYESEFLDEYLGTRPTDINVAGGEFIDTYHSHAPEELVPGSIFDTLDIKVYARPGSDYLSDGHGFAIHGTVYEAFTGTDTLSFDGLSAHPISILVANVITGEMLYEDIDFTVSWPNQNITLTSGVTAGDNVKIFVYEVGGGTQLHRNAFYGVDVSSYVTGDQTDVTVDADFPTVDSETVAFTVPVQNIEIDSVLVFINGTETPVTTSYYDDYTSTVILPNDALPIASTDFITVTVFGISPEGYEASYPEIVTWIYDGSAIDPGTQIDGKSRHNAIVEVNGLRLRPPEAARTIADGTAVEFLYPTTGGYLQDSVADNEVDVYHNNVMLQPGLDFSNSALGTGETRFITFLNGVVPDEGDVIDVYIRHSSDYWYAGTEIQFNVAPSNGDVIAVTTFRDVRELAILTEAFQGPTILSEIQIDTFESFGFDVQLFDFEIGVNTSVNIFTSSLDLIINKNRLWITLNGSRLHAGSGYAIVNDNQIVLFVPTIQATDVVVITSITDNVITAGATFRLFKDMRDTVGMYKLTNSSTTYLTQDLLETDDIIHLADASVLGLPDLSIAKFGILVINGERITYRNQDLTANTVSGLRRGTAGTGFATLHANNAVVADVSLKSLVQWDYDKIWYAQGATTASDGVPLQDQNTSPAVFIKT